LSACLLLTRLKIGHSFLLIISVGVTPKIDKSVAIFNMNSATDCPNADTERCQVPWNACYAHKAENIYPNTLPYRRRQEYLWDSMDPETWAEAFLQIVERKRNPVTAVRFSEAGDFRVDSDIVRVNRIAQLLDPHGIDVYTYSASSFLNWDLATDFTINQSNEFSAYGDRLFSAVPTWMMFPRAQLCVPSTMRSLTVSQQMTGRSVVSVDCVSMIPDRTCISRSTDRYLYIGYGRPRASHIYLSDTRVGRFKCVSHVCLDVMTTYADVTVQGEWRMEGEELADLTEDELRDRALDELFDDPWNLMIDVWLSE
jgi:hypothetical protein